MSGRQGAYLIYFIVYNLVEKSRNNGVLIIRCYVFTGGKKKPLKTPKKDQGEMDEVSDNTVFVLHRRNLCNLDLDLD